MRFNTCFKEANESKCRYVLMKGSAGSGKSANTAQLYILKLLSEKGRNLLVLRKSEVTNRQSTYAELCGAIERCGLWDYFEARQSPMEIVCVNGNKAVFRGMNDKRQREKIKSVTFSCGSLTDIWLEEATEFTKEDIEILDDRLRGELPDGLFYQMRFTFNPVSAAHWIKRTYFDAPDKSVFLHHSVYKQNKFLDKAFFERMERRKLSDPEGYAVYGLGEWGETGGLILTNWKCNEISSRLEDYDTVCAGQDFGFNHLNVILTVGFRDGDIYVISEQCDRYSDTSEIIAKCTVPKHIPMYCDSAEPDRIRSFRAAGFAAQPVSKESGSIAAQIDYLKGRRIFINTTCRQLVSELQSWKWMKDAVSGEYIDQPAIGSDDAVAALRYAVEGMRKSGRVKTVHGLRI